MRALQALALAVALTASTAATSFAGDGSSYGVPIHPVEETVNGDGSSYASPSSPEHVSYGEVWA